MSDDKSIGHCASRVYTIEVRLSHSLSPCEENGMLLTTEWRNLRLNRTLLGGVPSGLVFNTLAADLGYVSYDSAMALAWWFLASCSVLGVEARLVEHEFIYDYSVEKKTEHAEIKRHVWSLQQDAGRRVTEKTTGDKIEPLPDTLADELLAALEEPPS